MYTRLQNGLIDGISIGYEVPDGGSSYENGVRQLQEITLWEISLVTFPANTFARVTDVKSLLESKPRQTAFVDALREDLKAGRRFSAATESVIRDLAHSYKAHGVFIEKLMALLDEDDEKHRAQVDTTRTAPGDESGKSLASLLITLKELRDGVAA